MRLRDLAVEEPYILRVGLLLNMTGIVFLLLIFSVAFTHRHLKGPTILLYDL